MIWITWINIVWQLKPAFSRKKSFLWAVTVLVGFTTRIDQFGVASFIRSVGLGNKSYECLRQFFKSTSVDLTVLTQIWKNLVETLLNQHLVTFNERPVYLIDGIKIPKEGRRMPGLKWIFQQSQNNSKPNYIFGHSCQALHVLAQAGSQHMAIPLVMRIHEGLGMFRGTIVMRILEFVHLLGIKRSYIVADAYYWAGKLSIKLQKMGNHLVSRVKMNSVAYDIPVKSSGVGRPKKYGRKRKLKDFFKGPGFKKLSLNLYSKDQEIEMKEKILVCKNHNCPVKYVFVKSRGNCCIFASTDIELSGSQIIQLYSYRFKIEFSFKELVYDFGGFTYRFWSKSIERTRRKDVIKRDSKTEDSYHLYIQLGLIAQGLGNILAIKYSNKIWQVHRGWMRTIRPGVLPSSAVVRIALREELSSFLKLKSYEGIFTKFIKFRRAKDYEDQEALAA